MEEFNLFAFNLNYLSLFYLDTLKIIPLVKLAYLAMITVANSNIYPKM